MANWKKKRYIANAVELDDRLGSYKLSSSIIRRMLPKTIRNIHGKVVKNISDAELLLLIASTSISDASGTVHCASFHDLMEISLLSDKTTRNAINGLRDKGYITILERSYGLITFEINDNKFTTSNDDLKHYLNINRNILDANCSFFRNISIYEKKLLLYILLMYDSETGLTLQASHIASLMELKNTSLIEVYLDQFRYFLDPLPNDCTEDVSQKSFDESVSWYMEQFKKQMSQDEPDSEDEHPDAYSNENRYYTKIVKRLRGQAKATITTLKIRANLSQLTDVRVITKQQMSYPKFILRDFMRRNSIALGSTYSSHKDTKKDREDMFLPELTIMVMDRLNYGVSKVLYTLKNIMLAYDVIGHAQIHEIKHQLCMALNSIFFY